MLRQGFLVAVAACALTGALVAPAAWGAPPSNDTFAGATPVTSLPFAVTGLDVSGATVDDVDSAAIGACLDISSSGTVWYAVTVPSETDVSVSTAGSSYSAGPFVVTGSPSAGFSCVAYGLDTTAFHATPGTTYYVGIAALGAPGTLDVTFAVPPPPAHIDALTVDRTGTVDKLGRATVTGTVTCSGGQAQAEGGVSIGQSVGRTVTVRAGGQIESPLACDGTVQHWRATTQPADNGRLSGGKAAVEVFLSVFNESGGDFRDVTVPLHLRG